ncbi:MAG: LamG domain-containing protein, partial [Bacteroidia bacterium]|nr:LamG domain-containing protein [Bacteroidia bacterium]
MLVFVAVTYAQSGPGGVGDTSASSITSLWLRADAMTDTTVGNGVSVNQWRDRSGNGNHTNQANPSARPIWIASGLNNLPVVRFDGSNQWLQIPNSASLNPPNQLTLFVVGKYNGATSWQTFVNKSTNSSFNDGYAISRNNTANQFLFYINNYTQNVATAALAQNTFGIISGLYNQVSVQAWLNGTQIATDPFAGSISNTSTPMYVGAYNGGGYLNGDIAEIVMYNTALNAVQRILVENYLSSKYNLAIATDVYALESGGFSNELAGIGGHSGFIHNNSASSILRVFNPSDIQNNDWLTFAHNNGSLRMNVTSVPAGTDSRIGRVWRFDHTNDVGTVSLQWNVTGMTLLPGQFFQLLIDADGDFSTGATVITESVAGSGLFTGVTIPDGAYVTLARTSV